jgi:hypothetical protein
MLDVGISLFFWHTINWSFFFPLKFIFACETLGCNAIASPAGPPWVLRSYGHPVIMRCKWGLLCQHIITGPYRYVPLLNMTMCYWLFTLKSVPHQGCHKELKIHNQKESAMKNEPHHFIFRAPTVINIDQRKTAHWKFKENRRINSMRAERLAKS